MTPLPQALRWMDPEDGQREVCDFSMALFGERGSQIPSAVRPPTWFWWHMSTTLASQSFSWSCVLWQAMDASISIAGASTAKRKQPLTDEALETVVCPQTSSLAPGSFSSFCNGSAQSISLSQSFVASCTMVVLLLALFCIDWAQNLARFVSLWTRYLLTLRL